MAKYLTELLGTFFLVLTIGLAVQGGIAMPPLAIGTVLMVLVYMGGHVSGAHYNPAVSIGCLLAKKNSLEEIVTYIVSQLVGAMLASLLVYFLLGQAFAPAPSVAASALQALLIEIVFTFLLVLVVLNVAASSRTKGNSYFGLAIGFTILVAAFVGGPISGGAFNPAVGAGPLLVRAALNGGSLGHIWLYIAGPVIGGALAVPVFKLQNPGD